MRKTKLSEKDKKEFIKFLYQKVEENELIFRRKLEEAGIDISKVKVIDKAKFKVKYIPEVLEKLIEKYGVEKILADDGKIMKEAFELIERRFYDDLAKQDVKSWNAYYILLHCKIPDTIEINDKVKLVPFGEWPFNDYVEVLNKLFDCLDPPASRSSEKIFEEIIKSWGEEYGKRSPISILMFEDVEANSEEEVHKMTKEFAEDVILCMSVLTNSSIELKGLIIEGKLEGFKLLYPIVYSTHYIPTYMLPEQLKLTTKLILSKVSKNHLLRLILKYEKDALSDDDKKFALLKRWSALEFIAEEYYKTVDSNEKLLTKEEIDDITSQIMNLISNKINIEGNPRIKDKIKSRVGEINRKTVKEKVRSLIKNIGYPIKKFGDKDIIDIIYQHRNCIVHLGGCPKYDTKMMRECEGPRYCRESELTLEDLNVELSCMLTNIIGEFIGVKFEYHPEIPEDLKEKY